MFSTDEIAVFLNLTSRTKASPAFNPARRKVALAYIFDPDRTIRDILAEADRLRAEMAAAVKQRDAMQRNRIDRGVVHPVPGGR